MNKKFYNVVLLVISTFSIFYFFSLTFEYVEGDDASSVVYHALGRNKNIQPPFAPYQSMMDILLSVLPANEEIIRYVAISIHAIFGIIFTLLLIQLILSFNENKTDKKLNIYLLAFALPLAIPELIFQGLYYQCSSIALSFMMFVHILLKRQLLNKNKINKSVLALCFILVGIGSCFRWECGLYILPMFIDLWNCEKQKFPSKQNTINLIKKYILYLLIAAVTILVFVEFTCDGVYLILEKIQYGSQHMSKELQLSFLINIGSSLSLFSPIIILTFCLGFWDLIKSQKYILIILLLISYAHIPVIISTEFLNPRRIINSIPFIVLISYHGVNYLLNKATYYYKYLIILLLSITILFPWFFGLSIKTESTAWGPNFGIRRSFPKINLTDKIDNRVKFSEIHMEFLSSGFAVPFEGPRPVWGYGDVILGGKWRSLLKIMANERDALLKKAISDTLDIVQEDYGVNIITHAVEVGFTTTENKNGTLVYPGIHKRTFFKSSDNTKIDFFYPDNNKQFDIIDPQYFVRLSKHINKKYILVYCYSSSILGNIHYNLKNYVTPLGPCTAIVDLDRLRKTYK